MNNEQNNNIPGGIIFTPPTMPNNETINNLPSTPSTENTNIPGTNVNIISGQSPVEMPSIIPTQVSPNFSEPTQTVTPPINIISTAPPSPVIQETPAFINNDILTPTTPNTNFNATAPNTLSATQSTIVPELKIDSSSPFDIGVASNNLTSTTSMNQSILPQSNFQGAPMENMYNSSSGTSLNNQNSNINPTPSNNSTVSTDNSIQSNNENVVSVGKYLGHIILFGIPLIGFIMLIIKAVGDKKDKNITNFARAMLLLQAIIIVLTVVLSVLAISLGIFSNNIENNISENSDEFINDDFGYDSDYNYDY